MELSIIIPIYKRWHLVHSRLWELFDLYPKYENQMQIVLADDCSNDKQVSKGINFWKKSGTFETIKSIRNKENLGFGGNINKAIRLSSGKTIIIHTTDVQIKGDYIEEILNVLSEKPNALVGGTLLDWNTGWNKFGDKIFPYLEGWLLACKKKTWNRLGGFDERYGRFDYEDVDLSTMALKLGIELVPLNSRNLVHGVGGTIYQIMSPAERRKITEENKKKFEEKWIIKN